MPPSLSAVAFLWISREDYARFLQICFDRSELPATHEKWLYTTTKNIKRFERSGTEVMRVPLDLDIFIAWCRAKGLNIDSHARTEYANEIAAIQIRARDERKH